jgi:hypothetical protein
MNYSLVRATFRLKSVQLLIICDEWGQLAECSIFASLNYQGILILWLYRLVKLQHTLICILHQSFLWKRSIRART